MFNRMNGLLYGTPSSFCYHQIDRPRICQQHIRCGQPSERTF